MILTVENLAKSYGEKTLFTNISFSVEAGDRIGVVGINGTGKSTLLRTIARLIPADAGKFVSMRNIRMEYLDQDKKLNGENTVLAETFRGSEKIMQILCTYETILQNTSGENISEKEQQVLATLSEQIDALGGWQLESDAKSILTKLGINNFEQKVKALSGGQQKRLALAAALIQPCDLLLLDEPTNHLDMDTIEWLESYLTKLKCAVILVTHDRYFLDATAIKILELDQGQAYMYTGNYSSFLEQKLARIEREAASEKKRQNFLRNELKWIRRGAQARSTKQKARIEHFENVKAQKVNAHKENVQITLGSERLGRKIIEINNISFKRDSKIIIKDFSYTVLRNDRVGILGSNGVGKTTFLNLLAQELKPQSGSIEIGQTVKIGYFKQKNTQLDDKLRAIEYIKEVANYITLLDGSRISASQLMEMFLFNKDLQWVPIAKLSGGEKRRLYLLHILMSSPNVLLLDEPTNDLDLQTMAILESFIDKFAGAIVFVSHDRFFVDRIADKVFAYEGNGLLKQYTGGYSYYKHLKELQNSKEKPIANIANTTIKKKEKTVSSNKFTYKEKQEYSQIENVIAETEGRLKAVQAQMQIDATDYVRIKELSEEEVTLKKKLDDLLSRWTYLEEIAESNK